MDLVVEEILNGIMVVAAAVDAGVVDTGVAITAIITAIMGTTTKATKAVDSAVAAVAGCSSDR